MPLFKRFVEIGRVCLINFGPDQGKLCVIIDVVDGNRAFVDGPSDITGVSRQMISFRRLTLTDLKIKIPRSPRLHTLSKAFKAADIQKKWAATAWAKKIEKRKQRENLNDFERFQLMIFRKKRSFLLKTKLRGLKRAYNKDPKHKRLVISRFQK